MAEKKQSGTSRRTVTRILGHLGKVIQLLQKLKGVFPEHKRFFESVELELRCDALDITEMCGGLPEREDRLSCLRSAGIEIPDNYDEIYNED